MILETMLTDWMRNVFAGALEGMPIEPGRVVVVATADGAFGDYQCNAAMGLARVARRKPVEIASLVKERIEAARPDFLERVEVAGPGFLNLYLRTDWLVEILDQIAVDVRHGVPRVGEDEQC
jgi:arginyl-tRNA synthetase